MYIRRAACDDLTRIMEIYARAREFMAEHGNPNQWGPTNWPPEELIKSDISNGTSYVVCDDAGQDDDSDDAGKDDAGKIVGVFYYTSGKDIEPTYRKIYDGSWIGDDNYGVIHRIASDGSTKGVAGFSIDWAMKKCGHLRMDTHGDNLVMQKLLEKEGFKHCGTIFVEEDEYPRLAYEKI